MLKVWFKIKRMQGNQTGSSLVEVLLAIALFGLLTTACIGALVYGRGSTARAGDRTRAVALADEGEQAVRNIRDASYSNLTDGTYGLVQSGGVWTLSGTSDISGIYTRQVVIATSSTNRRTVTVTVSWQDSIGASQQVTVSGELTNWVASIKSWLNTTAAGSLDASGTDDGLKIATAGTYAYVVRNGGTPSFLIVNITNPASLSLVSSLTLAASPTNIFVSGNYAYVTTSSDSAELQIVNITTPASPSLVSSYNASGAGDGKSVYVSGNYAYLVRAANSGTAEFCVINVTTPSTPTLTGSYGNNVTMNDITVKGSYAYVGTSSGTILVVSVATASAPVLSKTITMSPAGAVYSLDYFNNTLLIGQAIYFSLYDITTQTAPTRLSVLTATGSPIINDIDTDATNTYAFLATNNTTAELQVVNIATPASPTIVKTVDLSGTTSTLNGIVYSPTEDALIGAAASDTQEVVTFVKG